jgi:diaminopimelate decarboxylase
MKDLKDLTDMKNMKGLKNMKEWILKYTLQYPTPFYLYDFPGLQERALVLQKTFSSKASIHYAMKANSHPTLLKL